MTLLLKFIVLKSVFNVAGVSCHSPWADFSSTAKNRKKLYHIGMKSARRLHPPSLCLCLCLSLSLSIPCPRPPLFPPLHQHKGKYSCLLVDISLLCLMIFHHRKYPVLHRYRQNRAINIMNSTNTICIPNTVDL